MSKHPALQKHPRQLFQLAKDWRGGVTNGGTMVEEKKDGVRAGYIGGKLLTREGVEIGGVDHILDRIGGIERAVGRSIFIDGEFIVRGDYRRTLAHIGHGAGAREQGQLYAFDCLYLDEWRRDNCDRPLIERKAMLARWLKPGEGDGWTWRAGSRGHEPEEPPLSLIPDTWCETQADVETLACEIWARGGEGVMLKDASAPYRRNRNAAWLKYKRHGWATRKVA